MIILKNISDETRNPATVDTNLTENPITKTRQWTEYPKDASGNVDKLAVKHYKKEDRSKKHHIVIKPGEMMKFADNRNFNEEQAEYLYLTYGAPDLATADGVKNNNWLIEVDKEGNEVKDYLFQKYRVKAAQEQYTGKKQVVIKKE